MTLHGRFDEMVDAVLSPAAPSVFSLVREVEAPDITLPSGLAYDTRLKMDGLQLLAQLPGGFSPVAFFDPQYRGILDKLAYGNEGQDRGKARFDLAQMDAPKIMAFIKHIDRVLIPTGHLFLWIDKFHLCTGFTDWFVGTTLDVVDLITWDKVRMGMGYRSRRQAEYLVVLQKQPRRAKGVWKIHTIRDVWTEEITDKTHTHQKPLKLQGELIAAVSNPGDIVLDPAAGSFSVLEACRNRGRTFIGCDIEG